VKDLVRTTSFGSVVRHALVASTLGLSLAQSACGTTAAPAATTVDIRGAWDVVAVAGSAKYPQTMHVSSEDLATGKFSGTDVGSGLTFTVTGSLSGSVATFDVTDGSYTSHDTATISGSGLGLTMTGTFTDSKNQGGTFSGTRTAR
jgi:hypothetical protein